MTQLPQPPDPNDSQAPHSKSSANRTRFLILLGLATIGVSGGLVLRQWVYTRLVPRIEASVVQLIDRPVELGAVEGFSLTHVRFGETRLPPTDDDPDRAIVESLRVSFNPLEVLINRSLSFRVVLRSPTAIIEQDDIGQWLDTSINELEPGAIEFKLDSVQFRDAQVALVPASSPPSGAALSSEEQQGIEGQSSTALEDEKQRALARRILQLEGQRNLPQAWPSIDQPFVWLQSIEGNATFLDDNKRISFDITGEPYTGNSDSVSDSPDADSPGSDSPETDGGRFEVVGELNNVGQDNWQANAVIQTQDLAIAEFVLLAPDLPVTIRDGRISSNIQSELSAEGEVSLRGTAQVRDVGVGVAALPVPVRLTESNLQFRGQQIQVENTTFLVGESELTATGRVDFRDVSPNAYNLTVVGESLDIATILEDVQVSVPIAVEGQLNTTVNITGPLQQPSIAGTINHASPIQVDRLELA
ncbi:MAG: DUF748 domain-containing protein, partial [Leptolyngbyaceae bacterium]|nr:DUF748 domain-containing protein [Leptolyngbyaceae bacterium]